MSRQVNATGNTALGGDWNLEYYTGEIDTPILLSPLERAQWMGLLAEEQAVPATEVPVPPAKDASPLAAAQAAQAVAPLTFEQDVGQAGGAYDFIANGSGYAVGLAGGNAVI